MTARDRIDDELSQLRVPPHSVEAEQSVIGCYVRRYSGLADAGCPEDFSSRLEIEA